MRCYHSGSEWTWEQWQWRGTWHSPNLQGWHLTIRWFSVISRTLIGGGLTPLQRCSQCILQHSWLVCMRSMLLLTQVTNCIEMAQYCFLMWWYYSNPILWVCIAFLCGIVRIVWVFFTQWSPVFHSIVI